MADRDSEIIARLAPSVGSVAGWDGLAGRGPFTSHAFLSLLEESGSVGGHSGWSPAPILVDGTGARWRRQLQPI